MKKILYAALLAASLFQAQTAMAECRKLTDADYENWLATGLDATFAPYSERQVLYPDAIIDVEANLSVNTTITTGATLPQPRTSMFVCIDFTGGYKMELLNAAAPDAQGIYPTNVQGVGYRVLYSGAAGSNALPLSYTWSEKTSVNTGEYISLSPVGVFEIELVKTGEMASVSVVQLGPIARMAATGDNQTALLIDGGQITLRVLPHCWVASDSSLQVDFGPFGPKEVSATSGPTKPVTIDVACDGPTPPNTISATLTATPDLDEPSFIKNNGDANNLAIRLREISSQTVLRPQDSSSALTKSSPGVRASFDLEASVLRVGSVAPTPGAIDAQAVVTLTFL